MAKGDDLQERFINSAVAIIKICEQLPSNPAGKHVSGQMLRSGTSPAYNYGEARGAESRNDFSHKLGVVLKELNETGVALEIAKRCEMFSADGLAPAQKECKELSRIINASIKTVDKRK
ncbi:MAG: four helix bundle protein [Ignavibacteriae bacterium]|nr:four helix bundle protein [Ignavibacteriota bacterium]